MLDSMIFAVDDTPAAAPGAGVGKASSWPEYPGEKPRKNELKKWIETWSDLMHLLQLRFRHALDSRLITITASRHPDNCRSRLLGGAMRVVHDG